MSRHAFVLKLEIPHLFGELWLLRPFATVIHQTEILNCFAKRKQGYEPIMNVILKGLNCQTVNVIKFLSSKTNIILY